MRRLLALLSTLVAAQIIGLFYHGQIYRLASLALGALAFLLGMLAAQGGPNMVTSSLRTVPLRLVGSLASLFPLAFLLGCVSAAVPLAPAREQASAAASLRFAAIVGVEADENPIYSRHLLGLLRASGLFERVEPLEALPQPDLIARVERHVYGTATIPVLTFLSLGLIPTSVEEEHGTSFSLRSLARPANPVVLEASYSGKSTLGWFALVKNLSPRFAWGNPEKTSRYRLFFRATVAARAGDIRRLLAEP